MAAIDQEVSKYANALKGYRPRWLTLDHLGFLVYGKTREAALSRPHARIWLSECIISLEGKIVTVAPLEGLLEDLPAARAAPPKRSVHNKVLTLRFEAAEDASHMVDLLVEQQQFCIQQDSARQTYQDLNAMASSMPVNSAGSSIMGTPVGCSPRQRHPPRTRSLPRRGPRVP